MEFPRPRGRGEGREAYRPHERRSGARTFEEAYRVFLVEHAVTWNEFLCAVVTVEGAATRVRPREIPYSSPEEMRRKLRETLHELVIVFEHSALSGASESNQFLAVQLYRQDASALPLLRIPRRIAP